MIFQERSRDCAVGSSHSLLLRPVRDGNVTQDVSIYLLSFYLI